MNRPGLDQGSDEWFGENATDVPDWLLPSVKKVCNGWQLLNTTDPNMVAAAILDGLKEFGVQIVDMNILEWRNKK